MNSEQRTILLNILPIQRDNTVPDVTEMYARLSFNNTLGTEVLTILHFMGILPNNETDVLCDATEIETALTTINDCINTFQSPEIHKIHTDFINDRISQTEYTQQINALKLPAPKANIIVGAFFISAIHFYNTLHKTFTDQAFDKDPTQAYINTNYVLAAQKSTIKIFERFERLQPALRAAMETAQKKTAIKQQVWCIMKTHNLGRPSDKNNNMPELKNIIKRIYQEQTGKPYPNADKTLENHIYDYPILPPLGT